MTKHLSDYLIDKITDIANDLAAEIMEKDLAFILPDHGEDWDYLHGEITDTVFEYLIKAHLVVENT